MSAKLFNEPHKNHRTEKKIIRNIDDLILDAELEAQAEIDQKLRTKNTRMLLLVLVGVGLLYAFINKPQDLSVSIPSFIDVETQIAGAPPEPGSDPKPIPFAVSESAEAPETQDSTVPEPNETAGQDLNPLENEVMALIQQNLGATEQGNPKAADKPGSPTLPAEPKSPVMPGKSPFAPNIQKAAPSAVSAVATQKPKTSAPLLTAEQSRFFIQVGAFSVKTNADRVIKRLMSGGFSPLVQTRSARASMYVVFIGGFADNINPKTMISELEKKGLSPVLKKNDNGSYSIILGKEKSKAKAEAFKEDLTRKGIFTSLKQMKIDSRMFIVRVGNFDSNASATENQKRIEAMGYKGTLIRKKS